MKNTIFILTFSFLTFTFSIVNAQVGINTDNSNPDASAMLDIKSSDKGMLVPRLTTAQRTGISSPATGLLVFDNTTGSFWYYGGTAWTELSTGSPKEIADADNDTKIQVEETADEDKIRFDVEGTEAMVIDNGNVGIGESTPTSQMVIRSNQNNTTSNILVLKNRAQTAVGTASRLVFQGYRDSNENHEVASIEAHHQPGDLGNTVHGGELVFKTNTGDSPYNEQGVERMRITNNGNVGIGTSTPSSTLEVNGLISATAFSGDGSGLTNLPIVTVVQDADNDTKIQIEKSADEDIIRFDVAGTEVGFINGKTYHFASPGMSLFIGKDAGLNDDGTGNRNVAIGFEALKSNTTGFTNTASGHDALNNNTIGNSNTGSGQGALFNNTTGSNNTANGIDALNNNTTGDKNTAIGADADVSSGDLINATAIGANATVNASNKIQLGNANVTAVATAGTITAAGFVGDGSGLTNLPTGTVVQDADNDTKIQVEKSADEDIIRFDVAGTEVGFINGKTYHFTSPGKSLFIGKDAGLNDDGSDNFNVAIGFEALKNNTTGFQNTGNGFQALKDNTTGSGNVASGVLALNKNTSGDFNSANGLQSLINNTTGMSNTATGTNALLSNTTGDNNTAIGAFANVMSPDLNNATANGANATVDSSNKIQLGDTNVTAVATAGTITAAGFVGDGSGLTNLPIGTVVQDADNDTKIQVEKSADEDKIRFDVGGTEAMVIDNGNVGIGHTSPIHPIHMGSGAHVTSGGVWINASDISKKYDIADLTYGLDEVMKMHPTAYRYKTDGAASIGFIAQEMEQIIPEVVSGEEGEKGIAYGLLTAVLVNAMQEQRAEIERLQVKLAEVEHLKQQFAELKAMLLPSNSTSTSQSGSDK